MCLVRHREVDVDVLSFGRGAIEALRQDPDIIVVGEMRDPIQLPQCWKSRIADTKRFPRCTPVLPSTVCTA